MIAREETTAILNTKTPFWSLGAKRRDEEPIEVESAPVNAKLDCLMSQLDAGIAQSTEREKAGQAGRRRDPHLDEIIKTPAAVEAVTTAPVAEAAKPAPAVVAVKPTPVVQAVKPAPAVAPKVELGVVEPVAVHADPVEAVDVDPVTSEALRLIADQRKAAEALLLETRALEDQIKNAAAAAQATRLYEAAVKKAETAALRVKTAAAAEEEANLRAKGSQHDYSILAAELKAIQEVVDLKRSEANETKAQIAQLERQLGELQRASAQAQADVEYHESRVRECATREGAAARSAAEICARATARTSEREAAEEAAQAAREHAEALKSQLPAVQNTGAIEDLQQLTARITEQVQHARNLRNGSLNGQKAS